AADAYAGLAAEQLGKALEQRGDSIQPGPAVVAQAGEQIGDDAVGVALERGVEQLAFASELLVDAGPVEAGALLQISDRGPLIALLPEQVPGGHEHRIPVITLGPCHAMTIP